jgi:hypothetical protein
VACAAVFYTFEPDQAGLLGGRIVAHECGAPVAPVSWPNKQPRHCPSHVRQLAEVGRLGLAVPDPAAFPPASAAEQPALL